MPNVILYCIKNGLWYVVTKKGLLGYIDFFYSFFFEKKMKLISTSWHILEWFCEKQHYVVSR